MHATAHRIDCPHRGCDHAIRAGAVFCARCGRPLQKPTDAPLLQRNEVSDMAAHLRPATYYELKLLYLCVCEEHAESDPHVPRESHDLRAIMFG